MADYSGKDIGDLEGPPRQSGGLVGSVGPKQKAPEPRAEVLSEATDLITGDRNVSYGTPTQNFTNIAEMWTTRFKHLLLPEARFEASDVGDAMILLKVARNIADTKRDTYVDIAGYAGCAWEAELARRNAEGAAAERSAAKSSISAGGEGATHINGRL